MAVPEVITDSVAIGVNEARSSRRDAVLCQQLVNRGRSLLLSPSLGRGLRSDVPDLLSYLRDLLLSQAFSPIRMSTSATIVGARDC